MMSHDMKIKGERKSQNRESYAEKEGALPLVKLANHFKLSCGRKVVF